MTDEAGIRTSARRWMLIGAGVIALGLFGGVVAFVSTSTASSMCPLAPEAEMAKAWSPEHQLGASPGLAYVSGELDGFAKQWIAAYRSTCTAPRTPETVAKLGCLLGERDRVAGITELIPAVPPGAFDDAELAGVLPRVEACDRDAPVTPPVPPEDPVVREKIRELRRKLIAARFADPKTALATLPALLEQAKAIGWDAIVAEAHQTFGTAAARAGMSWDISRDHYKRANELARRAHHYHLEADTWISLLWAEMDAATDPSDPNALEELVAQARIAVRNAGDDPVFGARITHVEGAYAEARGRIDEAIELLERARTQTAAARDWSTSMRIATDLAEALLRRDQPDDPSRAYRILSETDRMATEAKLSQHKRRELERTLWLVSRLRRDFASAHAWADRDPPPSPPVDAVELSGRVVDDTGPVEGATVVAWTGILHGDAKRIYEHRRFTGDIATTDADGEFTLRGVRGEGGIIAERGNHRSVPQVIGAGPLQVVVLPTHNHGGHVASEEVVLTGVIAIMHIELRPGLAWQGVAPVQRARFFALDNMPAAEPTYRMENVLDPSKPDRKVEFASGDQLVWMLGPSIDAIVRGGSHDAKLWVFRGRVTAKTRVELDALAKRASDVSILQAFVVGIANQTPEGMKEYQPGDRHAVFLSNTPGEVTVCVADLAPPECKQVQIPLANRGEPRRAVVVRFDRK